MHNFIYTLATYRFLISVRYIKAFDLSKSFKEKK